MNFKIKLESFEGPLDLLLKLIEEHKMDITQVSLAKVADMFLLYVQKIESIELKNLSDFLDVSSKLILIKSKILLPQLNLTEEEKEDIEELEKRLKEYQIFKRVSVKIKELANKDSQSFSRSTKVSPSVVFFDPPRIDNKNLFKIFQEVLEKISNEEKEKNPKALVEKSVSIEEKIGEIKNELDKIGQIQFGVFLKKSKSKVEVIVSFLAMLELLKQKILEAQQDDNFTDIILIKKEAFV
ncbi:hypothetical protein COX95_00350 [bacterium CG_4_10_14_0_2_um_filter_33_32]|nr:MAG: hypothetical protein AUJ93_01845 [bacterium CG2_30_33_46]PIR67429.1 MAG: hypothetical protein COU50_03235 [bacterium CG10_big_fil_rev_8_21_14_0_10_33_18]PIU76676.1 MAG: hypothetical protein COS74_02875 [bacterium CG06_land_8_20_14_3_00_33_50]PIW81459.1 MAG: hypothetical protein COZ97_01600 [bacterium CG_4_8_14_3_um_filter_33_28]PIY85437.1 MAG: hypothetical protein COY76_01985 [bacterium CG_4_10_14_0_8_um_filter_33_57]PIZ86634.1 MAG: hypothetical protein COX95_00350 [bacterium CG_4_10_1